MLDRSLIAATTLAATLCLAITGAHAFDEVKYPNWRGQWSRLPVSGLSRNPSWDPHKSEGLSQQAPLTPEYQAILEASLADQAAGGAGLDRDFTCMMAGMPRMMNLYSTMEILVMPNMTFVVMGTFNKAR